MECIWLFEGYSLILARDKSKPEHSCQQSIKETINKWTLKDYQLLSKEMYQCNWKIGSVTSRNWIDKKWAIFNKSIIIYKKKCHPGFDQGMEIHSSSDFDRTGGS